MKAIRLNPLRILPALAVCTALAGLTASAWAAPDSSLATQPDQTRHRQERIKARLDKAAQRLAIQPAQQGAWQAYVDAVTASTGAFGQASTTSRDAASIARRRADKSAARATQLAKIAEATASLQAVLTPDQRKTFDRMARHAQRHSHRHGRMEQAGSRQPVPAAPTRQ